MNNVTDDDKDEPDEPRSERSGPFMLKYVGEVPEPSFLEQVLDS